MISMNRPKMESRPYEFLIHSDRSLKERFQDFLGGPVAKTSCYQCRGCGFDPWLRKIPWRRKSQPTLKKEFIGPGLHLRPVHADHAQPPF